MMIIINDHFDVQTSGPIESILRPEKIHGHF